MTDSPRVLLLPGWLNSGPTHWQTRWELLFGFERVQQSDWVTPRRGDWMARLDEVLQDDPRPAVLVAHSLGCALVAAWAGHSRLTGQVRGALLVAPPDLERDDTPPQLAPWRPLHRQRLPFPGLLVHRSNDPFGSAAHAVRLAADWGIDAVSIGERGHINGESALGDWPQALAWLAPWGVRSAGAA
jgi:predicted alpha/beta hydrolase family esterase